jgi:serine/threonine protein phosphatase PrpC
MSKEAQVRIDFAANSDVGMVRDHNEDTFVVDRQIGLYAVADGMGGHAAGEVASRLAVETLRDYLNANRDLVERARSLTQESPDLEEVQFNVHRLLRDAFNRASRVIWEQSELDESKRGMGTTLSAMLLGDHFGYVGHVGDSRIYRIRDGEVRQITEDHSLVNMLLKEGRITAEEAAQATFRNAVTRAVGVYESVDVDTSVEPIVPGDEFLLASDGLTGYLEEDRELLPFFEAKELKSIPDALIKLANERGGKDNITPVVLRIVDIEGVAKERIRELNTRMDALKKMPFFKYLGENDLIKIFVNMHNVKAAKSTQIFEMGDPGTDLYLILTGKVSVHLGATELAQLGPGAHFGEMALIDSAPRSASITTLEDCTFLRFDRKQFFALVRREHELAKKILWNILQVLSHRLRSTSRELEQVRESMVEEISIDAVEVFGS